MGGRMKVFLIILALGLIFGFGTLLKLLAFSILTVLGLPITVMVIGFLLWLALKD